MARRRNGFEHGLVGFRAVAQQVRLAHALGRESGGAPRQPRHLQIGDRSQVVRERG